MMVQCPGIDSLSVCSAMVSSKIQEQSARCSALTEDEGRNGSPEIQAMAERRAAEMAATRQALISVSREQQQCLQQMATAEISAARATRDKAQYVEALQRVNAD